MVKKSYNRAIVRFYDETHMIFSKLSRTKFRTKPYFFKTSRTKFNFVRNRANRAKSCKNRTAVKISKSANYNLKNTVCTIVRFFSHFSRSRFYNFEKKIKRRILYVYTFGYGLLTIGSTAFSPLTYCVEISYNCTPSYK